MTAAGHERCAANERELLYLRELLLAEVRRLEHVANEREKQVALALAASQRFTTVLVAVVVPLVATVAAAAVAYVIR